MPLNDHELDGLAGNDLTERRVSGPRRRSLLAAKLETTNSARAVTLRDFSNCGARVEGSFSTPLGSTVILTRRSFEAQARVAWRSGNLLGLRFCDPQEADSLLKKQAPEPVIEWRNVCPGTSKKRPAVSTSYLSPYEAQLVRIWGWAPS